MPSERKAIRLVSPEWPVKAQSTWAVAAFHILAGFVVAARDDALSIQAYGDARYDPWGAQ